MNIQGIKNFCCDDISLIENYDKAINDKTQLWDCHHRLEIDLKLSASELIAMNMYYNRPANELIFLTKSEHSRLHQFEYMKDIENRRKVSEANKKRFEDPKERQKLSEKMKGKPRAEETRQKISEAKKKYKHWKLVDGKRKFYTTD